MNMRDTGRDMIFFRIAYGLVFLFGVYGTSYLKDADIEQHIIGALCNRDASYPLECLTHLWLEAGCLRTGSRSPENADLNQLSWWRARDIDSVKADMALYYEYAQQDHDAYPYKCFGNLNENCGYEAVPGHALYGQNEKTLLDADLAQCRAECSRMVDGCRSFDYNNNTRICFLSSLSRITAPDAFGAHASVTYYEKLCGNAHVSSPMITGNLPGTVRMQDGRCYVDYGPVGGSGGAEFNDKAVARHGNITAVRVRHANLVDALQFTYGGVTADRRGGGGGRLDAFQLDRDEYITNITGRAGPYGESITLTTNKKTMGPFGSNTNGEAYTVATAGKRLAYISGKSGGLIDQLTFHFYC